MSNSTEPFHTSFLRIVYSVEGLAVSLVNGLIVLVVLRYRPLRQRKEYFIMMVAALADMLHGLAFVAAGIGRTLLVYSGQAGQFLTPIECFLKPHNILFILSEPFSSLMMLVISCDRLFAVVLPLKYFNQTIRYSYTTTGTVFGYIILNSLWHYNNVCPCHKIQISQPLVFLLLVQVKILLNIIRVCIHGLPLVRCCFMLSFPAFT